jgi:glycosyltransferase involved in cell wall biosynthesis
VSASRSRVLFVGRARHPLPLPDWLAKKWDAVEQQLDYRFLGAAEAGSALRDERFRLTAPARPRRVDGILFYVRLPLRVRMQLHEFRPDAVVAADPFVGAGVLLGRSLARTTTPVIVEVHGDWRTFARLYGSPARKLFARAAEWLAPVVIRRADATRALSRFTSSLIEDVRGQPADGIFPTYSDLSAFTATPVQDLPERPTALFVGMLEAYKNVDGLASAWRRVVAEMPEARLVIIGRGSRRRVIDELVRNLPDNVEHVEQLSPEEVAARMDEATILVLPSWPEGLGRVIVEAFARGRGVVATAAGGVVDLVRDGREGLLVPRADEDALVESLLRVLRDRDLAARLGEAARARYREWDYTAEEFAVALRELVDRAISRGRESN